ncbi:MAG: hypothetical protein OXD43_02485 [Bacteroidetes bacterium]|nr:hypothetical protein [Bacteroidota bacterium]
MACRVGITQDPEKRKRYWSTQHPSLRNWQLLYKYVSKSAAQSAEEREAQKYGCIAHPGGTGPEYSVWYVYYFEY